VAAGGNRHGPRTPKRARRCRPYESGRLGLTLPPCETDTNNYRVRRANECSELHLAMGVRLLNVQGDPQ